MVTPCSNAGVSSIASHVVCTSRARPPAPACVLGAPRFSYSAKTTWIAALNGSQHSATGSNVSQALPAITCSAHAQTADGATDTAGASARAAASNAKAHGRQLMANIKGCRSWQELRAVFNAAMSSAQGGDRTGAATGMINHTHIAAFASTLVKLALATEAAGAQERLEYSRFCRSLFLSSSSLLPACGPRELSTLAWAAAKLGVSPAPASPTRTEMGMLEEEEGSSPSGSTRSKAQGASGSRRSRDPGSRSAGVEVWWAALLAACDASLPRFNSQDMSMLLWAIATAAEQAGAPVLAQEGAQQLLPQQQEPAVWREIPDQQQRGAGGGGAGTQPALLLPPAAQGGTQPREQGQSGSDEAGSWHSSPQAWSSQETGHGALESAVRGSAQRVHTGLQLPPGFLTRVLNASYAHLTATSGSSTTSAASSSQAPGHQPLVTRSGHMPLMPWSAQALSNTVWALARLRVRPSNAWLSAFFSVSLLQLPHAMPQALANTAWALAVMEARPPAAWTAAFFTATAAAAPHSPPASLSQALWGAARLKLRPPPGWVPTLLAAASPRLPQFSPLDLANTLWGVASLGARPDPSVLSALLDALVSRVRGGAQVAPTELAAVLWALATLQYKPSEAVLRVLLGAMRERLPQAGPQALANTLWALAKLHVQPDPLWMEEALAALSLQLGDAGPAELAICWWALGSLRVRPPPALASDLVAELGLQQGALQARELAMVLLGHARLGFTIPKEVLDRLGSMLVRDVHAQRQAAAARLAAINAASGRQHSGPGAAAGASSSPSSRIHPATVRLAARTAQTTCSVLSALARLARTTGRASGLSQRVLVRRLLSISARPVTAGVGTGGGGQRESKGGGKGSKGGAPSTSSTTPLASAGGQQRRKGALQLHRSRRARRKPNPSVPTLLGWTASDVAVAMYSLAVLRQPPPPRWAAAALRLLKYRARRPPSRDGSAAHAQGPWATPRDLAMMTWAAARLAKLTPRTSSTSGGVQLRLKARSSTRAPPAAQTAAAPVAAGTAQAEGEGHLREDPRPTGDRPGQRGPDGAAPSAPAATTGMEPAGTLPATSSSDTRSSGSSGTTARAGVLAGAVRSTSPYRAPTPASSTARPRFPFAPMLIRKEKALDGRAWLKALRPHLMAVTHGLSPGQSWAQLQAQELVALMWGLAKLGPPMDTQSSTSAAAAAVPAVSMSQAEIKVAGSGTAILTEAPSSIAAAAVVSRSLAAPGHSTPATATSLLPLWGALAESLAALCASHALGPRELSSGLSALATARLRPEEGWVQGLLETSGLAGSGRALQACQPRELCHLLSALASLRQALQPEWLIAVCQHMQGLVRTLGYGGLPVGAAPSSGVAATMTGSAPPLQQLPGHGHPAAQHRSQSRLPAAAASQRSPTPSRTMHRGGAAGPRGHLSRTIPGNALTPHDCEVALSALPRLVALTQGEKGRGRRAAAGAGRSEVQLNSKQTKVNVGSSNPVSSQEGKAAHVLGRRAQRPSSKVSDTSISFTVDAGVASDSASQQMYEWLVSEAQASCKALSSAREALLVHRREQQQALWALKVARMHN